MLNEHLKTASPTEIGALAIGYCWVAFRILAKHLWLSTNIQGTCHGYISVLHKLSKYRETVLTALFFTLLRRAQRCSSPSHCRSGWRSQAQAALGRDQIFVKSFVRMHSGQITATQAADKHLIYGSWQMETAIFQHGVQ